MKFTVAKPVPSALTEGLANARREWQANVRLRWGVRLIIATIWVWLALVAQDWATAWRAETEETRSQLQRLKPLLSEKAWPQRAEDARTQLKETQALLWAAGSQGQAEAMLQDRLRELCGKAGLTVRELVIIATDSKLTVDDARPLRVRLAVDMNNRLALMGLLSEIGMASPSMVVDTLRLRPQAPQPRAELEIRVMYREQAKAP
ncbi:MAG: hypothetical protein JNL93_19275 [Pelomonas sp.]|nr:hypothetical protein [Roseateles sp.]